LRVREPLTAEFSGKPAAYYKAEIEREEVYYERDSQGREERRTRTTTVYSSMKFGQCLVEDATGRVGIDFDGAEVETVQTLNEPCAPPGQNQMGGVIGGVLSAFANSNSTYRRKEDMLAPDIPVFVLGEVQQGGSDRQAGERLAQQDLRDQSQVEGGADHVAHQDGALAAGLHRFVLRPRRRAAGVVGDKR
jgi:hypothetical protein